MPTKRKTSKQQPLKTFFSRYSKFQYQPRNPPTTEFNRLCEEYRWEQDSAEKKNARRNFNLALKKEFDSLYGSDEKDINNWYKLCHVLRIDPAPNTVKKCRAAVSMKHVNLVDLVQQFRENIRIFESEKELSDYTKETEKFFPKEDAVDGGVLRALRRHILVPQESRHRQNQLSQPLATRITAVQRRAFHSRVPIPSRDCGDAPGVSALTMSSPLHAFELNSPMAPIYHSCASVLLPGTTSLNLVPAAAQRGCATIPTTPRNSRHVTSRMGGHHPPSSFPLPQLLANSHDRLYMSHHRLINRVGDMKGIFHPPGVPCPRGVNLSPLFQCSPSLPRAGMRVWRVIFPVG